MGQVEGKVALVTGAASGIGAACARTLAREGAKVVLTDINDGGGAQQVDAIRQAGGEAVYLNHDVTSEDRWAGIVAEVAKRYGRLDILVSNAGIAVGAASITQMSLTDWRRQTAINLDGVFLSVKHCIPAMKRSGGGSIIMMSSIAGLRGSPILAGYCATKGGVRLFAKSIAMECAQNDDNIRVNSVHPGIIDTPIWSSIYREPPGGAGHNVSRAQEISKVGVPVGYAGDPQDIANGVLFLASDASRYVTGSELVIDGGVTAGGVRRAPSQ